MNPLCHDAHQARFALPLVSFQCISHMCQLIAHSVVVHGFYFSDVFLMPAHPVLRSCALPLYKSDICCFEPAITLDDVQRSTNCVNWNLFFSSLLRFEPMSSGTETQHNINCASQTAVMMEGIIRVYMFNCTSASSS